MTLAPGAVYLERGAPVLIVTRWGPGGGPRNVAIRRLDGTTVVRPFRGLRVDRRWSCTRDHRTTPCEDCDGCRQTAARRATERHLLRAPR